MSKMHKSLDKQSQIEILDSVLHCVRRLFLGETQDEVLEQANDILYRFLAIKNWGIIGLNQSRNSFEVICEYTDGKRREISPTEHLPRKKSIVDLTIVNNEILLVPDVKSDHRFFAAIDMFFSRDATSLASMPMSLINMSIGALLVPDYHRLPNFDPLCQKFLLMIVEALANLIVRFRQISTLEIAAMTDPLTQLYNRRGFLQIISQEIERCKRHERLIAIMMIDIDSFKQINDTYGHQRGDEVLTHFAGVLGSSMRKIDYVCRYGGDEFIALMPDTNYDNALEVKLRIEKRVNEASNKPPVAYNVSIGLYAGHAMSPYHIFEMADRELYRVKQHRLSMRTGNI